MAVTLEQFIQHLTQSGLMSAEEVAAFQESLPADKRPADAQGLARGLVEAGKLTKYQARRIYQGQAKGLVLGNYVVLDRIGAGGMGEVLKARHRRMDRIVALKILPAKAVESPTARQRFQREVKAAARLTHPNIVTAHDADEHQGIHYLVMEYVEGRDLADIVKSKGPLPISRAVDCIVQAARGLDYAHKQGVVHRDIKPANLLLDNEGKVKILDMGLARIDGTAQEAEAGGERLTDTGVAMGTCDYMAPEQAEDTHAADHRADIYSLGCTLYRLLTAKPPFTGGTHIQVLMAHINKPIPSLCEARPDVPEELDEVFQRMIAKKPADRYQSMRTVIAALRSCVAPPQPAAEPAAEEPSSDRLLASFLNNVSPAGTATRKKQKASAGLANTETYQVDRETGTALPKKMLAAATANRPLLLGAGIGLVVICLGLIWAFIGGGREGDPPAATAGLSGSAKKGPSLPLAVAPFDSNEAKKHQQAWADHLGVPVEWENSIGMKFILIPPGEFTMGASQEEIAQAKDEARRHGVPESQIGRFSSESPAHRVKLTKPFYLGKYEVTQAEFARVTGGNSDRRKGEPTQAQDRVSWDDATLFCRDLSELAKEKAVKAAYRLPTEAEWEFACRAGTTTRFGFGDDASVLARYAWWKGNSRESAQAVGQLLPNAFGLYDMHGNVWEWCADWCATLYYAGSPEKNPPGPISGSWRISRGGSWLSDLPAHLRSACRNWSPPVQRRHGFRVACAIPAGPAELAKLAAAVKTADPKKAGGESTVFEPITIGPPAKPVAIEIKPEPLQIKPGERMSKAALVTNPAPLPGVRSWTIETIGDRSALYPLLFSPDGRTIVTGSGGSGPIRMWDSATGQFSGVLVAHDAGTLSVSWSPDGKYLASAGGHEDRRVRVWDVATRRLLRTSANQKATVPTVDWSPDGRLLSWAVFGGQVVVAEAATGIERHRLSVDRSAFGVSWSADGKVLAIGADHALLLFDVESGTTLRTPEQFAQDILPAEFGFYVFPVRWSPRGAALACGDSKGKPQSVHLWDFSSGNSHRTLPSLPGGEYRLSWSPDGNALAVCAGTSSGLEGDNTVRVWDIENGAFLNYMGEFNRAATERGVRELAWSPDGQSIAVACCSGEVYVCEAQSGRTRHILPACPVTIQTVVSKPDKKPPDFYQKYLLPNLGTLSISPEGHYRAPPEVEKQIVYAVLTESGEQVTLAPEEFTKKYGWKNDPAKVGGRKSEVGTSEAEVGKLPPMAVAPFDATQAKKHQQAWADHLGQPVEREIALPGGVKLTMVLIPPGEFTMGSTDEELAPFLEEVKAEKNQPMIDRLLSEAPRHRVRITRPFYLGKYEVTQAQWQSLMGSNPSKVAAATNPVEQVCWDDLPPFLAKLNAARAEEGITFVLPTEAQWEYACRAGSTTTFFFGNDASMYAEYGWFKENSDAKSHPVGLKKANGWGLHDMCGNVWECCADWYAADYYARSPLDDPAGAETGTERVIRGVSVGTLAHCCRSGLRNRASPDKSGHNGGFRLAAVLPEGVMSAKPADEAASGTQNTPGAPAGLSSSARKGPSPPPAVAPFDTAEAKRHQQAWAEYLGLPVEQDIDLGDGIRLPMVLIPPGEFMMGSTEEEQARFLEATKAEWDKQAAAWLPSEGPRHPVKINRPFTLGRHEVTRGQFRQFVKETNHKTEPERNGRGGYGLVDGKCTQAPQFIWSADLGFAQTDDHPVVNLSWNDALAFCRWLSKKQGVTYDLPTEAQWEYACRAGTTTFWHCGGNDVALRDHAWFGGTAGQKTHPVGRKKANAWGLYDMHGNVREWCADWFATDYYARSPQTDPSGPATGSDRVHRGGSWIRNATSCRSANRAGLAPGFCYFRLGFRVASVLPEATMSAKPEDEAEGRKPRAGEEPPMAVAPFDAAQGKKHQQAWADYLGMPVESKNSIGMKLVLIPPGEFMMGSSEEEIARAVKKAKQHSDEGHTKRIPAEGPRHRVRITRPFCLGMYEVTQDEYLQVMGANPSSFSPEGDEATKVSGLDTRRFPVETVVRDEPQAFCQKLSAMHGEKAAGRVYRLPTEAQWEYACRSGTTTRYSFGDDASQLDQYAWLFSNSDKRTHPVGEKRPNAWGLHDMHGNVFEWCRDGYAFDYYATSAVDDPVNPRPGTAFVLRGGSWFVLSLDSYRCAYRLDLGLGAARTGRHHFGFRVICEIPRTITEKGS